MEFTLLVAAAGQGTRMGGGRPKPLVEYNNQFLIEYSTRKIVKQAESVTVVVSSATEYLFKDVLTSIGGKDIKYVVQPFSNGTAHAVHIGMSKCDQQTAVIVWADHIGASRFSIELLDFGLLGNDWDIVVPVVRKEDPYVYFEIDDTDGITNFYETKIGAPKVKEGLSDCGVFVIRVSSVLDKLEFLLQSDSQDQNLLSLFPALHNLGLNVIAYPVNDPLLTLGANTHDELIENMKLLGE